MFEGLKGMAGMASLMKDLPMMQQRMKDVKDSLAELRVEATSSGNRVRVVATGGMEIVQVDIDPDGEEELGPLVRDTVNTALDMARQESGRRLAEAASDLGLPIPPGGLNLPGGM
jgi:DNA-binding protein YbaB